ncbi:MAG TPA: hypothetical protein VLW50_18690 [Streptosporangiaceae bacterium]|nr:hypothetical protein [Streptosporangiaceae bacterium]
MSRPPDPREDYLPAEDGSPGEPAPFDTESRVEHTDVDVRRLQELGHGQTQRPGGRGRSAEGGPDRAGGTLGSDTPDGRAPEGHAADGGSGEDRA